MKFKGHIQPIYGLQPFHVAAFLNLFFLLFIFMLFYSPFISSRGIQVRLPKAIVSDILKERNLVIVVTAENLALFNGEVVSFQGLRDKLSQLGKQKRSMLIKADRKASLGRVIDLWNLCRDLGLEEINIATNQD